ncbi:MAG: branched-chain amino acid ABC transporter permease [Streptosporangiaceae bacterium]
MSDTLQVQDQPAVIPARRRIRLPLAPVLVFLILMIIPFYADGFWLQTGLFAMAAAVGAIGLNLLTGATGQLSMGHAFFLAIGAYGYVYFAADSSSTLSGLGLPPLVAMVLAVALSGVAGLLFSPISGRLSGVNLGIATLALIFLGQHVLFNAEEITGGVNGRSVPVFELFGFAFDGTTPLTVLGIPFGGAEKLWYLGLVVLAVAAYFATGVLRSRPGRALNAIRDHRIAAGVMGVPVARYRASVFVLSSMYGGLAGVLVALAFQRTVPDYFGIVLSLEYLAMIVIGGLGTAQGAILGALMVTLLPQVLTRYSDSLPFVAPPGSGGTLSPSIAARFLYGAAVVGIVLFLPGGLLSLWARIRTRIIPIPRKKESNS